jgi:hypothetical protein
MLFYVVVAQIFLVEYDALSCVVATVANFPGLISYESSIKSSSFSPPPPPTIVSKSIVELFNSYTTQYLLQLLLRIGNLLVIFLF